MQERILPSASRKREREISSDKRKFPISSNNEMKRPFSKIVKAIVVKCQQWLETKSIQFLYVKI